MNTTAHPDPKDLRHALATFATGVTIVTARSEDDEPVGITANSFNSVSLDPPMVLWSLAKNARSLRVFERAKHWNVHVLASDQEALSNRFARAGEDKFGGLDLDDGVTEAPLIPGCSARFQCRTAFQYEGGDHVIFVGEVIDCDRTPSPPLVYVTGSYALAARKAAGAVATETELPDAAYSEDLLGYLLARAHFQFMAGFRNALGAWQLSDPDFFVLALLSVRQPLTGDEVAAFTAYTGSNIDAAVLQSLAARDLLDRNVGGGWSLSMLGRDAILHVLAAANAVEADVIERMGPADVAGLRNLLKRQIAATDPGLPKLWAAGSSAKAE